MKSERCFMKLNELLKFDCFVFDGDGTLFDSNTVKFINIHKAVEVVTGDSKKAQEFAERFIRESGVPREEKIFASFEADLGSAILEKYNNLNLTSIEGVKLIPGAYDILNLLFNAGKKIILCSAGDEIEVLRILKKYQMENIFAAKLMGAQKTKEKLASVIGHQKSIYFGDALKDFLLAQELSIPFVYVNGYTLKAMDFFEPGKSPSNTIKDYFEIERD